MAERTTILVLGDAGAVGGDLLRRAEIEILWALSVTEALAVQRRVGPPVCIVREPFAAELLRSRSPTRNLPAIVLLDPGGWAQRDEYFALGATALVQATSGERILEALSELTGLAFG